MLKFEITKSESVNPNEVEILAHVTKHIEDAKIFITSGEESKAQFELNYVERVLFRYRKSILQIVEAKDLEKIYNAPTFPGFENL